MRDTGRLACGRWLAHRQCPRLGRDPGHYIDLTDDDKAMGIVPLDKLPATREAYDTQLRAGGSTRHKRAACRAPSSGVDRHGGLAGWTAWRPPASEYLPAVALGAGGLLTYGALQEDDRRSY